MKKPFALLCAALMAAFALAGCGRTPPAENGAVPETVKTPVHVAAIAGPSGVAMAPLMERGAAESTDNRYFFDVLTTPDEVVAQLSTGAADIAAVPTNLAATLYNRTAGGVQLLAVSTKGVLSVVERGDSVHSVADLRGRTVYTTGQGANPEFVLRHVLRQNGLNPDTDVTLAFLTDNTELLTKLAAGTIDLAMTPEPVTTAALAKNAALRTALSMTDAWDALGEGSSLLMSCVVVRTAFLADHADAVEAFLREYAASIAAVGADVPAAAVLCERYGIIASAAIAEKAIPGCHLTYLAGAEMKAAIAGYYRVLFEADPKAVGGALPGDDFYYGA